MMDIKKLDIPAEVKKFVYKKQMSRILLWAIFTLLIAAIIVIGGDILLPVPENLIEFKYSCYVLFLISPVFFTKVYRVFTDTNYTGVVQQVNVLSIVDSKSSVRPSREMLYRKNEIHLTIESPNGKILTKKACETQTRSGANLDLYKVGDKVLHLHGTDLTIVLPTSADTHCRCSVCGGVNDRFNNACTHCKMPLIKSINYIEKG